MTETKVTEAHIRDSIAENLDLIEKGLVLVKTELHLPNRQGASGFLDIFARDATGKLVIIEIKRTDAAAREAIQELYKYGSLLLEKFLVKKTEVRMVLLSVEWHELATPYAEFAASAPFEVTAGVIILDEKGVPVAIKPVTPPVLSSERKIGKRHFLWGFQDEVAASKAVGAIARLVQGFGLSDFVLVESRATNPALGRRSFLYFAQRELRLEEYMALIEARLSKEQAEELRESMAELNELEDKVAEASDAVWHLVDGDSYHEIGSDTAEISHPEKGYNWFESGAQENIVVHRFGRFVDPWLEDQTIIDEIRGEGGESDFRLRFSARTDSPPQMAALRERIENVFHFNEAWRGDVSQLVRYAERSERVKHLELIAFCPEDILLAIAGSAFGFPGYVPAFRLDIESDGALERFIGLPEWDGSPPDFDKIFADHFSGDIFNYYTARHFGENRTMNHDIMADLGLRYGLFRERESSLERVRVQGASIVPVRGAIRSINLMIQEHHDEVSKLVSEFMSADQGFAKTIEAFLNSGHPLAERQLAVILESEEPSKDEMYWSGDITSCDVCEHLFAPLQFMVDAILDGGVGANVCARCFLSEGSGIGPGRGQVYEATSKGWRHIAG